MKWLALFSVVITVGHLYAYRTSNSIEIETLSEDDIEVLEEELYADLVRMEQKSDIELLQDEIALEQTNALCNDTDECSCKLNYTTVKTLEPDALCFVFNVSYCEGPCRSVYRYMCLCIHIIVMQLNSHSGTFRLITVMSLQNQK